MKIKELLLVFLIPAIFFFVAFVTLPDYGISWDEPIHFHRGHAYLNLFLTGGNTEFEHDYPDNNTSYFVRNNLSAKWFIEEADGGHPPLNGILSAATNYVFYQKLGLLGDIEAHHLFNIAASTLLVGIVSVFAYQAYGKFASLVAGIAMASYPLFIAESHFNIKDPVESAFIAGVIWTFWMSLKRGSWKWLIASSVFFGFAFGTKFNALFIPLIILPYLLIRYFPNIRKGSYLRQIKGIPKKYIVAGVLFPVIGVGIFFAAWPYLWADPINNFLNIKDYYQEIGTGAGFDPRYLLPFGFNRFAISWILQTTPPYTIVLFMLGVLGTYKYRKDPEKTAVLWLLWLIMPILRVTIPNMTIYGGVRQIMEFVPALALLCGLGAVYVRDLFPKKRRLLVSGIVLALFVPHLLNMIELHPNQNVYFNKLAGGLSGAEERQTPYRGNSFGNAYLPLINWLNEHAEKDAGLALVQGTAANIPSIMLREDITRWNQLWSGIDRKGEYLIELTHHDPVKAYPYAWDYINTFLEPVREVKVDGVAIAKLWKNDIEHTRRDYQKAEVLLENASVEVSEEEFTIELAQEQELTRLTIAYTQGDQCSPVAGTVEVSIDGEAWVTEPERVGAPQMAEIKPVEDGLMSYFFPARKAKYVRFSPNSIDSCVFNSPKVMVSALEK